MSSYSVARVLLLSVSSNGLSMALSFSYAIISTGILYKYFGAQLFGAWSTIFSLTFAFGFLNFGVGNATLNETAGAYRRGSRSIVTNLVISALLLSLATMVIVGSLGFAILRLVGIDIIFHDLSSANADAVRQMFAMFIALFAMSFPASVLTQTLRGLQQSWAANLCNCTGYLLAIAGTILGTKLSVSMSTMLAMTYGAQILTQIVPPVIILANYLRGGPRLRLSRLRIHIAHVTKSGAAFFALQLCTTFAWLLDYVLLSRLIGTVAAANFAIIQRLFQFVLAANGLVTTQLWPIFAFLFSARDMMRLRRLFYLSLFGTVIFSVAIGAIIWFLRTPISRVWTGASLSGLGVACGLYVVWACVQGAGNLFSTFLNAVGKVSQQVIPGIIFAGTAFALKIYWLPRFGISGLIVGSLCGYALGNAIFFAIWGRESVSVLSRETNLTKHSNF